MKMKAVEKIDIAIEQIEDSLKAYFNGRYYSALVLAGAAEQLFAGYVMKHGQTDSWKQNRATITKISNGLRARQNDTSKVANENEVGTLMNYAYNNSKHAGKTNHTISIDPKFSAQTTIERALSNYDMLSPYIEYNLPELPHAQRFEKELADNVRIE